MTQASDAVEDRADDGDFDDQAATGVDYDGDGDAANPCPSCGAMNDADAENCSECGAPMDGTDEEPGVSGNSITHPDAELRFEAPTRNLIRGSNSGAEFRAADEGSGYLGVLHGNFSTFNDWYEVNSMWEGNFLERIAPGAFADTIENDRANMRVLYDHGMDPQLGNKPLGPIRTLEERKSGAYYEVDLLDTDYNRNFIVPALRGDLINGGRAGSQLGASFAFAVRDDKWAKNPAASDYNPRGIPERTITRAQVFEFGPVTFPANPAASAGMRSMSDNFLARLLVDGPSRKVFERNVGKKVADRLVDAVPEDVRSAIAKIAEENDRDRRVKVLQRKARLLVLTSA